MRRTVLLALAPLFAACGGSASSDPAEARADAGTDAGDDASGNAALEGSYDVVFGAVTATQDPGGPTPPADATPSMGARLRLDVRRGASGDLETALTSRWGDAASFAASVVDERLTMSMGAAKVTQSFTVDTWTDLTFARNATGLSLESGTGNETILEGDVVFTSKLSLAGGTLTRDTTPPEIRATVGSPNGPADALLPWDPIRVTIAEPVDSGQLASSLAIAGGAGAVDAVWTPEAPQDTAAWTGVTGMTGVLAAWDARSMRDDLSLGATGLRDRAGNVAPPFAQKMPVVSLPAPRTTHDFDGPTPTVASWGGSKLQLLAADARCESGGCARLGDFRLGFCGTDRIGVAGLLTLAPLQKVAVRWRALASSNMLYQSALTVDVAVPGAPALATSVNVSGADLAPLASPEGTLTFATAWTTSTIALPAIANGTVGFSVRAGSFAGDGTCPGPVPPPVDVAIYVDSVRVE